MAGKRSKAMIRVGVVGIGRGCGFAKAATERLGMKLVALCDNRQEPLAAAGKELGVSTYADYDKFLEHDMDAVVLANYFHEHAPFAIKALAAGMHVMSETSACFTMAQGAALVEAVEKSGRIYMFAENYPYMLFNQEMRRLYQAGAVGQFVYGEGEYVHPSDADFWNSISPGASHWRNWLPSTYYCTHALGPLMFITDTRPVKVNACSMPYRGDDPVSTRRANCNDAAAILTVRMDSGAVVKLIQFHMRGEGNWVRVHGSTGQMENLRQGNTNMVRLRREQYHQNAAQARKFAAGGGGATTDQIYLPTWPREHQAAAAAAGHGGGDYFMNYHFSQAIRTGRQPFLDVYRGVAMSMVGIQGWRSVLDDSNTYEIPDFRDTSARRKYAKDHWNPDPVQHTKDMPWPSILGNIRPSKAGLAYAKKVWRRCGYFGE